MLDGLFEDKNPHQSAWFAADWDKVDGLVNDYTGLEKTNLFDIIEQITYSKKEITPEQLAVYNKWFVNNALSQNVDCLFYVDQMNLFGSGLSDEQHYNYYKNSIRKNKRYAKWAKVEYNVELEIYKMLISKRYKINLKDSEVYYGILSKAGKLKKIDLVHFKDIDFSSIVKTNQDKKILKEIIENL